MFKCECCGTHKNEKEEFAGLNICNRCVKDVVVSIKNAAKNNEHKK